jgi:branched-chain amino acid transport system permease protein
MDKFVKTRPIWSLIIAVVVAVFLWLVLTPWSPEVIAVMGQKRVFLGALLNGITLGALYFVSRSPRAAARGCWRSPSSSSPLACLAC